jgi:hypothetical protein
MGVDPVNCGAAHSCQHTDECMRDRRILP